MSSPLTRLPNPLSIEVQHKRNWNDAPSCRSFPCLHISATMKDLAPLRIAGLSPGLLDVRDVRRRYPWWVLSLWEDLARTSLAVVDKIYWVKRKSKYSEGWSSGTWKLNIKRVRSSMKVDRTSTPTWYRHHHQMHTLVSSQFGLFGHAALSEIWHERHI